MLKRMFLVVVVVALLVAMSVTPAFAAGKGGINAGGDCRAGCLNTNNNVGGGGPGGDVSVFGSKPAGSTGDVVV